ncbi:MAG: response regulator [Candidatus Cloacimonetes bacterium]|nr:response regulator [Candidatus Cloacimonadota bacterium]
MTERQNPAILIVDDSTSLGETISEILSFAGYDAEYVVSGAKALKKISENHFDLILSDINMPGMTGLELLERINSLSNEPVPLIIMTGFVKPEFAIQAVRLGAADFISKPIDFNDLLHSVSKQISRYRKKSGSKAANKYLKKMEMNFSFDSNQFVNGNITPALAEIPLEKMVDISSSVYNEIILCIEEMLSNAFIHSIFKVPDEVRMDNYKNYYAFLDEKLKNSQIKKSVVHLKLTINNTQKAIEIEVRDPGTGFDYQKYLLDDSSMIDFKGSGRGIKIMNILSDKLDFKNNGSTLVLTKYF